VHALFPNSYCIRYNSIDDVPKYYCTWIRYVQSDATHWELRKRLYKGGIDGGAEQWQLWFAKDWYWNGSQWVWLATWPMSSWFTNVDLAGSKQNSGNIVTVPYDSVVTMRTRYHEYTDHWYYWCSLTTQHNLSVRTSQQYGTGDCSDNPR